MKNKSLLMYAAIVVFAIFVIGGIIATIKSASFQMQLKSTVSNYTGGLDRTVDETVMSALSGKDKIQKALLVELERKYKELNR